MTAEFAKNLATNDNASIGQLLSALMWLNKDITQLRNRQKWIDENALPEAIKFVNNQITAEIQETERLIDLIELKIKNKCTS
jgi:hypothetical protein